MGKFNGASTYFIPLVLFYNHYPISLSNCYHYLQLLLSFLSLSFHSVFLFLIITLFLFPLITKTSKTKIPKIAKQTRSNLISDGESMLLLNGYVCLRGLECKINSKPKTSILKPLLLGKRKSSIR